MISSIVIAHLVVSLCAPWLARRIGSNGYLVMALVPAVGFGWLLGLAPLITSGGGYVESVPWIPQLGVEIHYRVGLLQWLLALIVTGIGALVLLYCRWYFEAGANPRTMGILTAFAAAMLGLVTVDDLVMLYVFWELTTVFSYLLIGYDPTRRANRSAAMTALIVTTTGGLAMLVGIVALGQTAGTFSLSAILAQPPTGSVPTAAALLMLVGALSKSALVPFHFWLPGAMAAPTPISAYLHAAAMVKAGVYLVAAMAPTFAAVPGWRLAVGMLGATTMILGGWRALRQNDIKLLLAYGTVSQLGFMVLLCGFGTQATMLAGIAMLIGHALFKATLFLIVGVVDHSTGTRDLTKLSGLGRRMPLLATLAVLAIGSGLTRPPLFGMLSMLASEEEQGFTLGIAQSAGSLARIAGPVFASTTYDWHLSFPYLTCAVIAMACGLWVWTRMPRRIAATASARSAPSCPCCARSTSIATTPPAYLAKYDECEVATPPELSRKEV